MAGHSKWNNIKRRKEAQDSKRAKIFTKLSKEIFAAVREAGDDPDQNLRLRMAITKARAANIPNENITRTIKKAKGQGAELQYEEMTYEGYGPGGAAVMVKTLTDNKNRTVADIRAAFNKNGGNLGENGCVSFLFNKEGFLAVDRENVEADEDTFMLEAVEAGANDVEYDEHGFYIYTEPDDFEAVKGAMEHTYHFSTAEVTMIPETKAHLEDEHARKMLKLIDTLEDNDDVQSVYHNFEAEEEQMERLEVSS